MTDDFDLDGEGNDGGDSGDKPDEAAEKRIRDLQSKADAAEARANKAEAALKERLEAADKSDSGNDDPRIASALEQLREANLDAVYASVPDLAAFGIDRALVEGGTRAEMRDSAAKLVALIGQVATKARNDTLAKAGLTAEPMGGERPAPVDYGSMSKEEFDAVVKKAVEG